MIEEANELLDTVPFDDFCNEIIKSFDAINAMIEISKSGNIDLIKIIEDGRK